MNHNQELDFFNIPLVLQHEVLGSWLTIKDGAKMDSAMCSKAVRPMFLDLLSNDKVVIKMPSIPSKRMVSWMTWIVARKVSVTACHIFRAVAPTLYKAFFASTGKRLETITIEPRKDENKILFTQMLSSAAPYCTNIKEITFRGCSSVFGLENILRLSLRKTICKLIFNSCDFTDYEVPRIKLPSLKFLCINNCATLTNASLKHLLATAPNLETLSCIYLRNLTADVAFPRSLRSITITNSNMTDVVFLNLVHRCPLLEVVQLENLSLLTDVSIIELVQHCKHINALYLTENWNFTNAVLQAIAVHCGDRLKVLNLDGSAPVTDAGLKHIIEGCHNLEELNVGDFDTCQFSTASIQALVSSNPLLQEVELAGLRDADVMLRTLSAHCPQLRYLNIQYCRGYTGERIQTLMSSCRNLRTVVID